MKGPIVVLAAAIRDGDRYLLTQRAEAARHNALRWELPGGKLEPGENFAECLEREIREETSLEIDVGGIFGASSHVYDGETHIVLLGFLCTVRGGDVAHAEIADHRWLSIDEMTGYDITEADLPLIGALRKHVDR